MRRVHDDTSEKERQLAEESRGGAIRRNKKTAATDKEIADIRKRLKYAESDLSDLEDEECQFEQDAECLIHR